MEEIIMKKSLLTLLSAFLLLFGAVPVLAETDNYGVEIPEAYYDTPLSDTWEGWPSAPPIYAESGILVDMDNGKILYSKNVNDVHYPASITKIMTAYLAAENCSMDEIVTFSQTAIDAIDWTSSNMGTLAGEELTMEQCMYGMMLQSANEVCCGVAEHVGGSIQGFVDMMNQKAAELGCTNTHFTNPNGLPDENHYTTAYDYARISAAAFQNETFRKVFGTTYYEIPPTNKYSETRQLGNHHKMLLPSTEYYYDGIIGGKTGYTQVALNTLVTFANRNGKTLMCVTMRTEGRQVYRDTASLFDYGFASSFPEANATYLPIAASQASATLPSPAGTEGMQPLPSSDETQALTSSVISDSSSDSQTEAETTVSGPGNTAKESGKKKGNFFLYLILLLLILVLVYIGLVFRARMIRKRRRMERMRRRQQRAKQLARERNKQQAAPNPDRKTARSSSRTTDETIGVNNL